MAPFPHNGRPACQFRSESRVGESVCRVGQTLLSVLHDIATAHTDSQPLAKARGKECLSYQDLAEAKLIRYLGWETNCASGFKSDRRVAGAVVSGTFRDAQSFLYGTRLRRMHGREEISNITWYPLRRTRYPVQSRLFADFDRGTRQPDDTDARGGRQDHCRF